LIVRDNVRVRFNPLDVAFTVMVSCVGGGGVLPPPQAGTSPRLTSRNARAGSRFRVLPTVNVRTARTASPVQDRVTIRENMTGACSSEAALIFDASVTVTVKAYEDDPFGGTVAGDTAHVVELGPPQLSETAPLKPPIGDTCRL
jgi:hypothetical protein